MIGLLAKYAPTIGVSFSICSLLRADSSASCWMFSCFLSSFSAFGIGLSFFEDSGALAGTAAGFGTGTGVTAGAIADFLRVSLGRSVIIFVPLMFGF
ncbi:MAG TPA: hypothetical protein PLB25_08595, partial [Rhodoferax sp.]|nr:hypothetical protein [Rhodoferax sp.]